MSATQVEQSGRRDTVLAVAGLMLALFLVALDQTVVGTALPKIIADLDGFEHYAWVTTAYLLASTSMIPVIGKLGDIYGRKWFIIAGVALFLVASALCGAAWGMTELILFRGLQGLGAGMIFANIFTSVADIFPDPARRAKYQGVFFSVFALTSVIGPTMGGVDHGQPLLALGFLHQPAARRLLALRAARRAPPGSKALRGEDRLPRGRHHNGLGRLSLALALVGRRRVRLGRHSRRRRVRRRRCPARRFHPHRAQGGRARDTTLAVQEPGLHVVRAAYVHGRYWDVRDHTLHSALRAGCSREDRDGIRYGAHPARPHDDGDGGRCRPGNSPSQEDQTLHDRRHPSDGFRHLPADDARHPLDSNNGRPLPHSHRPGPRSAHADGDPRRSEHD